MVFAVVFFWFFSIQNRFPISHLIITVLVVGVVLSLQFRSSKCQLALDCRKELELGGWFLRCPPQRRWWKATGINDREPSPQTSNPLWPFFFNFIDFFLVEQSFTNRRTMMIMMMVMVIASMERVSGKKGERRRRKKEIWKNVNLSELILRIKEQWFSIWGIQRSSNFFSSLLVLWSLQFGTWIDKKGGILSFIIVEGQQNLSLSLSQTM